MRSTGSAHPATVDEVAAEVMGLRPKSRPRQDAQRFYRCPAQGDPLPFPGLRIQPRQDRCQPTRGPRLHPVPRLPRRCQVYGRRHVWRLRRARPRRQLHEGCTARSPVPELPGPLQTWPRRLPVATPCRQGSLGQALRYRKGGPPEDWPRPPQGRGGGPTPPPLGPGPAAPPAAPTIPVPTPALPKGYLFLEAEKRAAASLVTLLPSPGLVPPPGPLEPRATGTRARRPRRPPNLPTYAGPRGNEQRESKAGGRAPFSTTEDAVRGGIAPAAVKAALDHCREKCCDPDDVAEHLRSGRELPEDLHPNPKDLQGSNANG